jgi:hypothetical protein
MNVKLPFISIALSSMAIAAVAACGSTTAGPVARTNPDAQDAQPIDPAAADASDAANANANATDAKDDVVDSGPGDPCGPGWLGRHRQESCPAALENRECFGNDFTSGIYLRCCAGIWIPSKRDDGTWLHSCPAPLDAAATD